MQRQRPTILLVMAILNFVMGGLCGLMQMCGLGGLLFIGALAKAAPPGPKGTPGLQDVVGMYDYAPGFYAVTTTYNVVGMILNVVLVIAGIGLLNVKTWARWTCVVYSIATILLTAANTVYTIAVVQPAMQRWQQDFLTKMGTPAPPGGSIGTSPAFGAVGTVLSFLMYSAYPIALLIVMFLPAVAAAFAGTGGPLHPPDLDEGWGGSGGSPPPGPPDIHVTPRRY